MLNVSPKMLRFLLNIYGPFLGAGVKVLSISPDWREVRVCMKMRWYNRNAVGTHFGGSLYSMVDPHLMLMLMKLLGKEYIVWDKAAEIDFVSPGRGTVYCKISISDEELETIKSTANSENAILPEFDLDVTAEDGTLVTKVKKVLYIKKKN